VVVAKAAELSEGAVERALGGVDAALEAGEGVLLGHEGAAQGLVHVLFVPFGPIILFLESALPGFRLGFAETAEEPVGGDQGVDEDGLFGARGLEAFVVAGFQSVEVLGFLAADDLRFGVDAGFEGVHGREGFARDRAGAGALLRITTIRFDLVNAGHKKRHRGRPAPVTG